VAAASARPQRPHGDGLIDVERHPLVVLVTQQLNPRNSAPPRHMAGGAVGGSAVSRAGDLLHCWPPPPLVPSHTSTTPSTHSPITCMIAPRLLQSISPPHETRTPLLIPPPPPTRISSNPPNAKPARHRSLPTTSTIPLHCNSAPGWQSRPAHRSASTQAQLISPTDMSENWVPKSWCGSSALKMYKYG